MADFTPTQGRYLAFIHAYIQRRGFPPAESEIAAAMCVSPPSVNQMVKTLEKKGLVLRQPGQARALQILIPEDEIPPWGNRKSKQSPSRSSKAPISPKAAKASPPAKLFVLTAYLVGGPIGKKFSNKIISREIEIRGDQTLEELHHILFKAFDREEEHLYEFQFGKRPFDPEGANYGVPDSQAKPGKKSKKKTGDARKITLDDLDLQPHRTFGYWFDFGDNWYHHVNVERIEQAIPTVPYPRIGKRVGKSPPQHADE